MSTSTAPSLTVDEIDDLLYFTRANEAQDLQETVSQMAQKYGCTARDVLEACKDPENGNTVLHYSAANGLADLAQWLLAQSGNSASDLEQNAGSPSLINQQNREGNTPLHWAAYNGHLAVVKLLVGAGVDMWMKNAAGHLAMFEAERADKNDVVQYLLEAGGKEVERAGTEGRPLDEDVAEMENSDPGIESSSSTSVVQGDAEDKMEE
nr:ankyrin repeat-containing protein yar1 [Quercus suber]